jgi:hypothetical protein
MLDLILPLSFNMSLISWALIAKWYFAPALAKLSRTDALTPLLLLHSFRHIGMAFLIPGVTAAALDPRFAKAAAYGDLLAALLALVSLLALHLQWRIAIPVIWLFNIFGTFDLLNALIQGLRFIPTGHLGSLHLVPAVLVPLLLVTHGMVFVLLLRREPAIKQRSRRGGNGHVGKAGDL